MLVVADTSPLNYLVWVEAIEILPRMYGNVSIPAEVRSELLAPETPPKVREWALALPSWIAVQAPCLSLPDDPQFRSLDPGERAALALAASQPSLLLIDERAGTAVARNLGLRNTRCARRSRPEGIDLFAGRDRPPGANLLPLPESTGQTITGRRLQAQVPPLIPFHPDPAISDTGTR